MPHLGTGCGMVPPMGPVSGAFLRIGHAAFASDPLDKMAFVAKNWLQSTVPDPTSGTSTWSNRVGCGGKSLNKSASVNRPQRTQRSQMCRRSRRTLRSQRSRRSRKRFLPLGTPHLLPAGNLQLSFQPSTAVVVKNTAPAGVRQFHGPESCVAQSTSSASSSRSLRKSRRVPASTRRYDPRCGTLKKRSMPSVVVPHCE